MPALGKREPGYPLREVRDTGEAMVTGRHVQKGATALHVAARHGRAEAVRMLADAGGEKLLSAVATVSAPLRYHSVGLAQRKSTLIWLNPKH